MEVTNRYITIKAHIDGAPKESDFELKDAALPLRVDLDTNVVIVKNLYVSIDPYQLNRIKSFSSSQSAINFAAAVTPGEGIDAYGVGKVVVSGNPEFEKDDLVVGLISWGDYTVVKPGFSGLTAYAGLFDICKPKKGEKVFVSAASGSVGNLVGQYAKLFGCYVVGSAGSKEKVAILKEKLGFDDAFNYKEVTDLKATLKRYFPDGIDIYFDNVGAEMQEAAVANMKAFGRVAVCGVISEYIDAGKRAAPDMLDVVYKRIKIQGFLAADHMNVYQDFLQKTSDQLSTGKIQALEDISDGVESIPSAFVGLFRGDNIGKKIVRIALE
ncbi:hypothetical protein LWI29_033374 [Acer saccharum]|uniref:Enoyl reductase (ER) domain-containing protein n=1 Tax=Acer saccharum TaxID=4024 RepID=A0AA39SHW7_ACESA|nr:hypothetical protein LWI29_033374 [Acer saccharum]